MNTPRFARCAGAVVALAIVSACSGGSSTVTPSAATPSVTFKNKTMFVAGRPVTALSRRPMPVFARLVPAAKNNGDYEYVFNDYGTYASIFNYPKSTGMVGQIDGLGGQGCTNVLFGYGKKIFWNAGRTDDLITEYQVPDKKLRSLSLDYTFTSSCAMNKAGDLAVGVLLGNSYGAAGQQVVFKKATGKPTVYNTPLAEAFFAGYDPKGNLFADGFGQGTYDFAFVELPAGSSTAVTVKLPNQVQFPGSVQWDGKYMTVFDQLTSQTFQYAIHGTKAVLKNTITYTDAGDCAQTWIVKGLMYCGDAANDDGSVYAYPAGGAPLATFTGSFDFPLGTTAAKK
jgi:hypothetical protein